MDGRRAARAYNSRAKELKEVLYSTGLAIVWNKRVLM